MGDIKVPRKFEGAMPSPLKILLIEDDTKTALDIQTKLRAVAEFEFCVDHFTSASSLADILSEQAYDAILLDTTLPGDGDGETVVRFCRSHATETPIVVLSETEDAISFPEALKAGADAYLNKDKADGNRIALSILSAAREHSGRTITSAPLRTPPNEILKTIQPKLLQRLNSGAALKDVLNELVQFLESLPEVKYIASILLLDPANNSLHLGAAPSLPTAYNREIEGLVIGPSVGSCGTAAFCKHPIYVVDIETDPLWEPFRPLAREHGLRACWSVPILDSHRNVLGTFALYYRERRMPTSEERDIIHAAAQTSARLIEAAQPKPNGIAAAQ